MPPQYPETTPLQQTGFAIITGLPLLAACFVAVRIYARKRMGLPLDWDDYVVAIASVLSMALIYPSYRNMQMWHFGHHVYNLDQRKLEPNYKEYHRILLAFNIINTPILPLVKASILLLLLKVGKLIMPIRRSLYFLLVFIAGACIGPWIAMIFMCEPRSGNKTSKRVFGSMKCLGSRSSAVLYLFVLTVNIVTDLLILPIPNILLWKVRNITLRARMTVLVVSLLMLGATGIAVTRFVQELEHQLYKKDVADWTYTIRYTLHHAENNVAIMLACMPMLRTLITHWRKPRYHLSSSTTPYSSDIIRSRKICTRDSSTLLTWEGDGVIDPSPQAISKSARAHAGEILKDFGDHGMVFEQDKNGKIVARSRGDDEVGLTAPSPVHQARSESSQTRFYDSEPEGIY